MGEKPNYEIGSSAKLSFAKKPAVDVKKVWKIDVDDDEEMIDADDLLDEEDKQKPAPESLRVCSTTGKRKACKDCSCGLAEELESESNKKKANATQKSSCGSVSLTHSPELNFNKIFLFSAILEMLLDAHPVPTSVCQRSNLMRKLSCPK